IDEEYDPIDLSYFFGEGVDSVCVDPTLYPDRAVIERCALEHDWGEDTDKLIEMWARVKGDNASSFTYVIIVAAVAVIAFMIYRAAASRKKKAARKAGRK
ncbi:MAG: spermidine/putrescine ABC transporter, partial [Bacteroidales bacterium]|nr:spermidine/putrescine ABC transporter [Bacteroidales bacterium]